MERIKLIAEIKAINKDTHLRVYGSPRMTVELKKRGFDYSENTIAKLMRENGIEAKRNIRFKPKTTTVDKEAKYSPNALEDQSSKSFGEKLVSDITYIPTKEGWLYLAVVIDLFSRVVTGHKMSVAMPSELITSSLLSSVNNWAIPRGSSIFHSDRGTQYTSEETRKMLKLLDFTQSMSAKGNCYDNATCESFFATLKREILPDCGYFETRREAQKAIFDYIEGFYNTRRCHSSLGNLSPMEFLQIQLKLESVA